MPSPSGGCALSQETVMVMGSNDAFLFVIGGGMFGWDACVLDPNWAVRWAECHPSATQALATVAGLAGAAWVPIYIWRRDRAQRHRERRLASESFAAALLTPFAAVRNDVSRVRATLIMLRKKAHDDLEIPSILSRCHLVVPLDLALATRELYRFDNAVVGPMRTCVTTISAYNAHVDSLVRAANDDMQKYLRTKDDTCVALDRLLYIVVDQLRRVTGLH